MFFQYAVDSPVPVPRTIRSAPLSRWTEPAVLKSFAQTQSVAGIAHEFSRSPNSTGLH